MRADFKIHSEFEPTGDQPAAIDALTEAFESGQRYQVLEGVTGSGKTFTMSNVIKRLGRPTLVISHNKTLAAQLYSELKEFFPENAVEYFVSYYDYYQPEAYIPQTDTFIEKDASINDEIERLRLAATDALINRSDVILVASVSCIYGLGSPEDYKSMLVHVCVGDEVDRDAMLDQLVAVQYSRNDIGKVPGTFSVRGDTVEVFPSYSRQGLRIGFFGDEVERIQRIDPLTGKIEDELDEVRISPAKHFVMPAGKIDAALEAIRDEMEAQVIQFEKENKLIEAQRIRMRTEYDIEMLRELGFCSGIENYARHLTQRNPGDRPDTLIDYFPKDFLTIIDESHVSAPQIRGMFNGDQARKRTLVEHGFRLPSAMDNRPMAFNEFLDTVGQTLFVSATPGPFERENSPVPVEQIIRPTGLVDPPVEIRPLANQIDDLIEEVRLRAERNERVLVTTLTKRVSEDLSQYMTEIGLRVQYLHSDIGALERVEILRGLRKAEFDCLIGINLLREGLDIPEVTLVAILDADKEGFLRSETSLIQTAGRAARNADSVVIMYADRITGSMQAMLDKTMHRRTKQLAYNAEHGITPTTIVKKISEGMALPSKAKEVEERVVREAGGDYMLTELVAELEKEMLEAAQSLEFERAAILRDQLRELKGESEPKKRKKKAGPVVYSTKRKRKGKI